MFQKKLVLILLSFKKGLLIKFIQLRFWIKKEKALGALPKESKKEGLEFGQEDYEIIEEYCNKKGIDWFASAWDIDSLIFLDQFKSKYNKIASAMIVDTNFLEEVAKRGKHTFISTGMSTLENIDKAVSIFNNAHCSFELMHCVSTYPMKVEDANLKTIEGLKNKYKCNVGYSGHETGVAVSVAATALGASSLERHITLDRSMYGSDQSASLEPRGLRELIGSVRIVEKCIGEEKIGHIFESEIPIAEKLRSHIKK